MKFQGTLQTKAKKIKAKIITSSIKKDLTDSYNEVLGSTDNSTINEVLEEMIQALKLSCEGEYTFSG